jgi:tetratricopeptide (TPR) repeat protein
MNEIVISKYDFEKHKNNLKNFSEKKSENLELEKVEIKGFCGIFNHKVTGYELNSLTAQIQRIFVDINNRYLEVIKEFGEVYNVFEKLDKEYVTALCAEVEGIKRVSSGVEAAQNDIARTIEIQKKTINALKQFKEKIESYEHLVDIDKIWNEYQELQEEMGYILNAIGNVTETVNENTNELQSLQKFKKQIEEIKHLKNVDEIWDKCNDFEMSILSYDDAINANQQQIETLQNTIQEIQKRNEENNKLISKKFKAVYALAGGSLGFAIIELILILMRIL